MVNVEWVVSILTTSMPQGYRFLEAANLISYAIYNKKSNHSSEKLMMENYAIKVNKVSISLQLFILWLFHVTDSFDSRMVLWESYFKVTRVNQNFPVSCWAADTFPSASN